MSLTTFLQQCLTGISLGGAYALIAIGYTLVYGILRLINFAHGDIFMMAGYFMIFAMASLPWFIAIPVTLIVTILLGVTIERVVTALAPAAGCICSTSRTRRLAQPSAISTPNCRSRPPPP